MYSVDEATSKLRVLLVEDRAMVREALAALLQRAAELEVATAESWAAERTLEAFLPDVAVVCLGRAPDVQLQLAQRLLHRGRGTRVVLLDEELCPAHVGAAAQIGAHGYWTTRASSGCLLQAVRRAAAGRYSLCPASLKYFSPSGESGSGQPLRSRTAPHQQPEVS